MDSLREYVISIIVITLICSVLEGILQNSAVKKTVKTMCGLVLTLTVASPLWNFDLSFPDAFSTTHMGEVEAAVKEGESMSSDALCTVITQKTEAYIQDKANALGADISAKVGLSKDDPPVPQHVVISGQITQQERHQLQMILQTQLGITEENIEWIG